MGAIEDLQRHVADQVSGFAIAGASSQSTAWVFANWLADDTNTAIGLFDEPGVGPMRSFGSTKPVWRQGRVQVISRAVSPVDARDNATDVYYAFEAVAHSTLSGSTSGVEWMRLSCVNEPFFIGRDDANRNQFALNADWWRRST